MAMSSNLLPPSLCPAGLHRSPAKKYTFSQVGLTCKIMHRLQVKLQHLKELSTITYEQFQVQLIDLNDLCRRRLAGQATQLEFVVQPLLPHMTLLWKALVRVECRKLSSPGGQVVSARLLNLRQLMALMRDLRALSSLPNSSAANAGAGNSAAQSAAIVTTDFTASSVLDMVLPESGDEAGCSSRRSKGSSSSDIEECCICMDRQAEILLACAHAYCQTCIDQWLHGGSQDAATSTHSSSSGNSGSKTCPLCRSRVTSDAEGWVITTLPDDVEPASLMLDAASRAGSAMTPE